MQTFLPFSDFCLSARALDRSRLGKQRVEVKQILKAHLSVLVFGMNPRRVPWFAHPASRMWLGHELALTRYGFAVCDVWTERGYADEIGMWLTRQNGYWRDTGAPGWLGDQRFHRAHQGNLIRKNPAHFRPMFPAAVQPMESEAYVWPVLGGTEFYGRLLPNARLTAMTGRRVSASERVLWQTAAYPSCRELAEPGGKKAFSTALSLL